MRKTFVLDTNVLLHSAQALESFKDNIVILPMAVIEELDKFKKNQDELGRNARQVIRRLDMLRGKGSLAKGVEFDNGNGSTPPGILKIVTGKGQISNKELDMEMPDNRILRVAYHLHEEGENVILITKDINLRLKADAIGLPVMDFEKQKINFDELFSGFREINVNASTVDEIYQARTVTVPDNNFFPNEFVLLRDETNPKHTALAKAKSDTVLNLLPQRDDVVWNIKPRSKEQRMAFELLLDPEIQIVTLVGQAGSGKTLLALAAGLELVLQKKLYEKILVSRPIVPLGNDIGYLPGTKDEKLSHWMQPIFDNLDYLMHSMHGEKKDVQSIRKYVEDLTRNHQLELEAITYIRGRSIPRQYVIVDEAQNLTPHEIKTIVSRAGEGTKMVLTGDPYQIDNPYLDASSNGLTYTVERFKNLPIHGHITLRKSERSPLAAAAAEYL
ncbi:MAG: phosphate starvation-inducible protein PhoH [Lentisphaerae bacterium GWF2_44_16]|nr:MAG: phosphate starvation-inducible protein PhoH [Lentisphaerae bacterium GWF2_44_16]